MELVILVIGLGVCVASLYFIKKSTSNKTKYGINLEDVACPSCGTTLPKVRRPENLHQAMWGGWTCPSCGAEINKWGELRKK